jgi:hypothetical protein
VQSQQLPTESQVFEDEVLPRTEGADHPAEEMSERRDHSKNLSGKARIELCAKSIHFKGVRRFGEAQDEVFGSHWDFRANLLPLRFAEYRLASAR